MLKPRTQAPELEVSTVGGTTWRLSEQQPEAFTLLVFYRGLHCPICKSYLRDLNSRIEEFGSRGVEVLAVSGDTREWAEQAKRDWGIEGIPVGYGQSVPSMREWGLFVSRAIKEGEPAEFGEPGLFLIRPDGTLYYAAVQSMPFGRPPFGDLLGAIDFVTQNDYPARGEA